jgi:hypothetical protein
MTIGTPRPAASNRHAFRVSRVASMRAARAVDLITGRLGAARPVVFVSGFWRSGTTWMQELLAKSLHAKTVFEPLLPTPGISDSR